MTEAAWLLRKQPKALQQLLRGAARRLYQVLPLDDQALTWSAAFHRRYRTLEPQLADACLVYLAEEQGIETIFTLDRRDFSVFRLKGNRALRLLPAS